MSSRDRQRRILEHLAKSANGFNYVESPRDQPSLAERSIPTPEPIPEPTPEPTPVPSISAEEERKRRIMSHVQQSSESIPDFSASDKTRQKRIQDHLKKSLD
jgi:hypothetical protein